MARGSRGTSALPVASANGVDFTKLIINLTGSVANTGVIELIGGASTTSI